MGLNDWLPDGSISPGAYFGRETASFEKDGVIYEACAYISDYSIIKRSWSERLFSRPWKPFLRTKQINAPKAYVIERENKTIMLLSYAAYSKIYNEINCEASLGDLPK